MFKMESVDDLWDHIGYVVLCAPDSFPVRDYLTADQQMNLERAFEQLRQGVGIAYPEDSFSEKRVMLHHLLEQSYAAYKDGERKKAAHLLQDFQGAIFK